MIVEFKKKYFSKLSATFLLEHIKIAAALFLFFILISFFFLDKSFALYFQAVSSSIKEPFLLIEKLFCPIFWSLLAPTLFFFIRFVLKQEKKSRNFWFLSLALPLPVFACKILEVILGRATPEWFFLHLEAPFRLFQWDPSFHSFPSMVSCTIAAFATALSCIIPKSRLYILLGGLILSFSPVITTSSFLSEAIAGLFLGSVVVQWIYKKVKREMSLEKSFLR